MGSIKDAADLGSGLLRDREAKKKLETLESRRADMEDKDDALWENGQPYCKWCANEANPMIKPLPEFKSHLSRIKCEFCGRFATNSEYEHKPIRIVRSSRRVRSFI